MDRRKRVLERRKLRFIWKGVNTSVWVRVGIVGEKTGKVIWGYDETLR